MNLKWKGNQKYNEDISKATIRSIDKPIRMSIHKYVGCGDLLYFTCPELGINKVSLNTEDFDEAEIKALKVLKNRCNTLVTKVETILQESSC